MARKSAYAETDLVTVAEARNAVEEATRRLQERIDTLIVELEDAEDERDRLRDELENQSDEAYINEALFADLDHALAFGHTDRVIELLTFNSGSLLTRNNLQVSLTLN